MYAGVDAGANAKVIAGSDVGAGANATVNAGVNVEVIGCK